MIAGWVARHDPRSTFLCGPAGSVTYGELGELESASDSKQVVVAPRGDLDSVRQLMSIPGDGCQLVLMDPGLPEKEAERRRAVAEEARDRRAATIVFTSGTTGPAKAARLTVANWEAAVGASAQHLEHGANDIWLAAMPLHHVGGLAILFRSAFVGAGVYWLPRFSLPEVVEALRGGVTMASFVPTMLRRVLNHDDKPFEGVRAVLVGGGPIPPGLIEEAHARGLPALPTYGMTETCAQVATLRPGSGARYAAHPLPGIEIRLEHGGRVALRGGQVSPGYADEDDRAEGEWFVTPDLGVLDPDGAVRILGRADDVIITGGENVNPGRVEAVLMDHPGVWAAAVVGVEDEEWGRRVAAVYQGEVAPEDLDQWARQRLSRHELPGRWRRVTSLPSTALGKPDRTKARELIE
jgi:O-succinylbenzoic acid--CoA ligase